MNQEPENGPCASAEGTPEETPAHERLAQGGLLLAALACAAWGQRHFALGNPAPSPLHEAHRNAGLVWYALAVVPLVCFFLWLEDRKLPQWPLPKWAAAALLGLCVVVGAGIRFHRLDELPPGLWQDEALNGIAAFEIAAEGRPRVYLSDRASSEAAGFVDFAAVLFRLFEPENPGYGIRAALAVLGVASLAALAVLARVLFGARAALVAVAWIMVSQYHMNYSRWACPITMSGLFEALFIVLLLAGLRRTGRGLWLCLAGAGLALGLGIYSYFTFRTFLLGMAVFGVYLAAYVIRRRWWDRLLPCAAAGALALVVALPMVRFMHANPEAFGDRARMTLVMLEHNSTRWRGDWPQAVWEATQKSLLAFQFVGDSNARHNLPRHPQLTFLPALLAPVGLVLCLCRAGRPEYVVLVVWFAFGVLPGAITHEAPHASRLHDALFPLAVMIGLAADRILGFLQGALPRGRSGLWLGLVLLAVAGGVAARQELAAYFVEREKLPEFYDAFLPHEAVPGRHLAAMDPGVTAYVPHRNYWGATTRYLGRRAFAEAEAGRRDVRCLQLTNDLPPEPPVERAAEYLLSPDHASLVPVLRQLFPRGTAREFRDPFGRLDLAVFHAPQDDLERFHDAVRAATYSWPHGLLGRYFRSADRSGDPFYEGVLPLLLVDRLDSGRTAEMQSAEWTGHIALPADGQYFFRLNPSATTLEIDGNEILRFGGGRCMECENEGHVTLMRGVRPIRIGYRRHPEASFFLWFSWQPPGGTLEPVPATALYPPGARLSDLH